MTRCKGPNTHVGVALLIHPDTLVALQENVSGTVVCMCVCVHACTCVYSCVLMSVCTSTCGVCVCVSEREYMRVCVRAFMCVFLCSKLFGCIYCV